MINESDADWLHLDIMDGVFVPNISFGFPVLEALKPICKKPMDVHLMIEDPDRYIDEFVKSGADIITVHVEACADVSATIDKIHAAGVKAGITLNPDTPVSAIKAYLSKVDMALVMSVNPGFGGQKFITESIDKIKELRRLVTEMNLNLDIEVDGGIKQDNLASVLEAGANVIVAGSAIFAGSPQENVRKFKDIMNIW